MFPNFIFLSINLLDVISIKNNPLRSIHENAFQNVKVKLIESTSYQICCIVNKKTKCNAEKTLVYIMFRFVVY